MTDRPSDDLVLAAEFPAATYEQWRGLVQGVLKGARFEDRLQSRTADGLTIDPLYRRTREPSRITAREPGARWQVMQRMDHPDPAAANPQALEDLDGGVNGLVVVGAGALGSHGYGLMSAPGAIERALDGVHLDAGIAIEFDLSPQTKDLPLALAALIRKRGLAPDALDIRFGFDPVGVIACNGGLPLPWNEFAGLSAALAAELAAQGFTRALAVADGRVVHDAGGTEAQELAYVIAAGLAMLRAFEAGGIALDDARRMIFFRLAADADQFLTIAKFRALRMLWRRIEDSCGLAPEPAFVAAETAWRMTTRHDPQVNILRATIATFAAGIGGADAITVLPFTAARGLPDAFARRLARNTQLVLLDEAHVATVNDPTAGTGWSEDLTDRLCRAAWALLQEIEQAGGAVAALEQGLIQQRIAAARTERERAVATRGIALVGTNEFPDLGEAAAAVLDVARPKPAAMPIAKRVTPIVPIRLAEPFEALRDASDRMLATAGGRPRIFLANLGAPADFTARAAFAKNLFEAGGVEAVSNDGFTDQGALAAALKRSGAQLACLCGSDERYAADAANTVKTLKDAGATHLWAAGKPGKLEADLRRAGIESFVYHGCDILQALRDVHRRLGM